MSSIGDAITVVAWLIFAGVGLWLDWSLWIVVPCFLMAFLTVVLVIIRGDD